MIPVEKISRGKFVENLAMFLLLSLPSCLLFQPLFQNDTYWLLNTGRYILSNGLPHVEPFTIHSGLHFVAQQWLTTVIFYVIFEKYGALGLYVLNITAYATITFLVYRLALRMANGKKLVASYIAAFVGCYLCYYMVLRPQVFSLLIFIIEVLLLEYYVRNQQQASIPVAALIILSILLINLHSAMWPLFFLLYAPYLIDSFNFRFGKVKGHGYRKLPLFVAFLLSVAAGLANPYGVRGMLYLINSYGDTLIGSTVQEMLSPDFKSLFGIVVFALLLTIALIYVIVGGTTRLRYALLTIGTLYMGLCSVRSFSLFVVFGVTFLAYYLKDIDLSNAIPARRRAVLIGLAVLVMVPFRVWKYQKPDNLEEFYKPQAAVQYIKDNVDLTEMRLYNDYNTGGYIEFSGIRAFIDSRAEVFTKRLNRSENVYEDYVKANSGELYFPEFITKYSFTHFLVYKGQLLDNYLRHDPDCALLYQDSKYVLYAQKQILTLQNGSP